VRVKRGALDDAATNPSLPSVRAAERLVLATRAPRAPHRGAEDSSIGDLVRALIGGDAAGTLEELAMELELVAVAVDRIEPREVGEFRVAALLTALAHRAILALELHRRIAEATGDSAVE
jgi:hypothetical protein